MKKIDAYLTVEASLVLPIVIMVILLIIYLLFFQYDRCLMEQNTGILALRGCTDQFAEGKELVAKLVIQSQKSDNRYLAWNMEDAQITLKGNSVSVKRSGTLIFPFQRLMFWNGDGNWTSECTYENKRVWPVQFVRNCRKIMGGK